MIFVFYVYAVGKLRYGRSSARIEFIVHVERERHVDGFLTRARYLIDQNVLYACAAGHEKSALVLCAAVSERHADFAVFHVYIPDVFLRRFVDRHFYMKVAKRKRVGFARMIALLHERIREHVFRLGVRAVVHFFANVLEFIRYVLTHADMTLPPKISVVYHDYIMSRAAVNACADHTVARGKSLAPCAAPPRSGSRKSQYILRLLCDCHTNLTCFYLNNCNIISPILYHCKRKKSTVNQYKTVKKS